MLLLELLLPAIPGLEFENFSMNEETLTVIVRTTPLTSLCPICH